jgi:hypothetical protein
MTRAQLRRRLRRIIGPSVRRVRVTGLDSWALTGPQGSASVMSARGILDYRAIGNQNAMEV